MAFALGRREDKTMYNMTYAELQDQYRTLRHQLEIAYAQKVWDSCQIDRIADQIARTEAAIVRSAGAIERESPAYAMAA